MALVMSAGVVFAQTTLKPSADVPGVYIYYDGVNGASWTGAVIALGSGTSAWPWSAEGANGAAFTPTPGATYRVAATITSTGMTALRVRWTKGTGYGEHTSADIADVSTNTYAADAVATKVPAYFNSGIANGDTKTFLIDVTMDGSAAAEGLIGNIAFVGGAGSNAFTVDKILVTDAAGNQLVNYDANPPAGPVVLEPSADVPGVHIASDAVNSWTGAIISLGSNTAEWPWSAAGASGVAFTPVKGATYRMAITATSSGTSGFRVRWVTSGTQLSYTTTDGNVVGSSPYSTAIAADEVATVIPAYFQNTIANGETKTFTIDVTMDGDEASGGLVGNIVFVGQQGNNNFTVDKIVITDAAGNQLVNYQESVDQGFSPAKLNKYKAYGIEGGIVVNANENVSIFSFDGRLVKQAMGGQTIPMEKGLYIVKTATQADKVIVK